MSWSLWSQALAALQFVALLPISGWGDTYVHYIVARRLVVCGSVRYLLLRHNAVDFCRGKFKKNAMMFLTAPLRSSDQTSHEIRHRVLFFLPVKMFLKASSTFVESNADVSINERVFFSNVGGKGRYFLNMHIDKYFTDSK